MIGIKYCGGCNPRYDRKAFVNKVEEYFKDQKEFELAKEDVEYEALMVVGGCQNCCASYQYLTSLTKPMLIWGEEFFNDVEKRIKEL